MQSLKNSIRYLIPLFVFILLILSQSDAQISLSNGLVAYYPFYGNANDYSGKGNHGTLVPTNNGPQLTTDRFGNHNNAYLFDGNDDQINLDNKQNFRFDLGDFSIALWFTYDNNFKMADLISKRNYFSPFSQYRIGFFDTPLAPDNSFSKKIGGFVRPDLGSNNSTLDLTVQSADLNSTGWNSTNWHFVVLTYEYGEKLRMYLNGNPIDSMNTVAHQVTVNVSNLPLVIGGNQVTSTSANFHFAGKIDDIRIYERILLPAEIKTIFDAPVPIDQIEEFPIFLHPNPLNNKLTISWSGTKQHLMEIEVLSGTGKRLLNAHWSTQVSSSREMDLSSLPDGIYLVKITSQKGVFSKKIIKKT